MCYHMNIHGSNTGSYGNNTSSWQPFVHLQITSNNNFIVLASRHTIKI
jgi:hypothetical protein